MQGGLEPIVALGGEDLGPASVLSRIDGKGEDFAGCGPNKNRGDRVECLAAQVQA